MPLRVPPSRAPPEAPIQPAVQPHHQQPEVTPHRQLIRRPMPHLPIRSRCCVSIAGGATPPPKALAQPVVHPNVSPWRRPTCLPICVVASPTVVSGPQSFLPPCGASIHSQGAAQPPASRGATQPSLFHLG
ncbi:hypothetical protein ACQJBY_030070 [Aegilops geniculata]